MVHNTKKIGISVIVCCFNSTKVLPKTLEYLSQQNVKEDIGWEIIVVNNNSTDNTTEVAQHSWQNLRCKVPFQVVDQPKPGLSFAREKGFEMAAYEYMLLCDDDNWLQADYVQLAYELMNDIPAIGILGGKGEAVFEAKKPDWFEKVQAQYATGPQAAFSGDISDSKRFVFGAGAVVRYTAYKFVKKNGFESLLTDRKGKELSSGGDNELCYVFLLAGYKIWYDDQLKFKHFLTKERLTWNYLVKLNNAFAVTAYYLRAYTYYFSADTSPKCFIWLRDLRHLLKFLPKIVLEVVKSPKGSDEHRIRQILLRSHLHLIRTYLENRSELDAGIYKVGELVKRFKP